MRIHLMRPEDASVHRLGKAQSLSRWRAYVDTYILRYPTEWLPSQNKESSPVFLRRWAHIIEEAISEKNDLTNNRTRQREDRTVSMENWLKIGMSLPSYKIVYERGSEEMIRVEMKGKERALLEERARNRDEQRKLFRIRGVGYF